MTGLFWWVVYPYIALTVLILGLLYRFAFRQASWAAPSTEIFEKKWLRVGSTVFHYGIVFAFVGHVMGVLIPRSVYHALGVHDETYHFFAIVGGGLAGLMVVLGLVLLLIRKILNRRVRAHAGFADYFAVVLLLIVAANGTYMTIVYNTTVVAYEYRTTIGPWFRSLLAFHPDYHLMDTVPLLFQLHVLTAFLLFASIPFTKLVHMFSLPVRYPARAPQQYRSRVSYKRR
ncbi:Nitrate reductase-like protein NarX [compost metagenome]|uniref:respiratory nitrate reductase subunit gamma n=1 Tax=Paenibacillus TaxID=44249 RepID=UPI000FAEFE0C|nr:MULTISPECIES: respiratory nitrate reductase subunit gamma [Paenibacillus]MBW4839300.1 respiratory nitrate reductase subunit gamma [Paenibacillaceae bacterium]MUG87412.1 respiratory nitrate reductase subunit gamma [Paenibacillus timonensis]GIP47177.1 nitrate reductase subunit gamma [Paenibacillus sp. J53TS2]